ncbi:MAG TPA: VOC family protein [Bryobacteraceae bacterium]|nr:VOC family protein [Bryobacteraceae bacterium]
MAVSYKPDHYHSVTPYLVLNNAAEAIEWYVKAFGAQEMSRMAMPGGKVMHAELKIGDSCIMLSDEFPHGACKSPKTLGGTSMGIHLYVPDVDPAFQQAVQAGAEILMPPMDMFWGDRFGKVRDPFGHEWSLATHTEDVTEDEMMKRAEAATSQFASVPQ